MSRTNPLIWIDMEMTGLNPDTDTIIEIATIVTDADLNLIAEGPVVAIYQPENVLSGMDEWNTRTHNTSGLADRVRESNIMMEEAEEKTLAFLRKHTQPRQSPMCGNTIGQDRMFMRRHMPNLENYFHYRNVDVSSIKELVYRWYPEDYQAPPKKRTHLALDDIRESIEELQFYRRNIFAPAPMENGAHLEYED